MLAPRATAICLQGELRCADILRRIKQHRSHHYWDRHAAEGSWLVSACQLHILEPASCTFLNLPDLPELPQRPCPFREAPDEPVGYKETSCSAGADLAALHAAPTSTSTAARRSAPRPAQKAAAPGQERRHSSVALPPAFPPRRRTAPAAVPGMQMTPA